MNRLKPSWLSTMTPSARPSYSIGTTSIDSGTSSVPSIVLPALVVERVVDEQRLAVLGDPAGEALADLDAQQRLRLVRVAVEHLARERDRVAHAALPVDAVDADVVVVGQRLASATIASAMARTSVSRLSRAERSWIERMRAAWSATER